MLTTGAGWSADSGLAVYKDIANVPAYHSLGLTYYDLCQPRWLKRQPAIFHGFWGACFNDYRDTPPHAGSYRSKPCPEHDGPARDDAAAAGRDASWDAWTGLQVVPGLT